MPDRWRQVTEIYHAALARDTAAREAFLREACQGDPSLRDDVDALVVAHGEAGSFGSAPLFPDSAARLSPGTRLGAYQIAGLLGAGGMGEVYRARDERLNRLVAIKVIAPRFVNSEQARERFEREARAIAAFAHPNICTLYDVGSVDGVEFLVMEHLEGETLATRLARTGEGQPLPLHETLLIATQLADAPRTRTRGGADPRRACAMACPPAFQRLLCRTVQFSNVLSRYA